jgi:hypothetical protein
LEHDEFPLNFIGFSYWYSGGYMSQFLASLSLTLGALLPTILLAVVVLVVGWIIASVISGLVRKLLQRTSIDEKITGMLRGSESPRPEQVKVERWASTIVFGWSCFS